MIQINNCKVAIIKKCLVLSCFANDAETAYNLIINGNATLCGSVSDDKR